MRNAGDLAPLPPNFDHPAATVLHLLRTEGAPVPMSTEPWSASRRLEALRRGSHPSTHAHGEFLRNELADLIAQKFWIILPFELVCHLPSLRLSPMGVIPQRDRRHRVIADYSFSNVNADTLPAAPNDAMQFGHALDRLLYKVHHANRRYGPVYLIKVDLADGFYRVPVKASDAPTLGVAFPHLPSEPPLVAIPLVLPMGWVSSPPFFCAVTETITDNTNQLLRRRVTSQAPHRLSYIADHPNNATPLPFPAVRPHGPHSTATPAPPNRPAITPRLPQRPLAYVDIYMDDFVALAQGHPTRRLNIRSTLFHQIDAVLRPLDSTDAIHHRKEPISVKKLNKGDALWSTRQTILGWIVDTYQETITLPAHRAERLLNLLDTLIKRRRISFTNWQKVLGELQSMILALPGDCSVHFTPVSLMGYDPIAYELWVLCATHSWTFVSWLTTFRPDLLVSGKLSTRYLLPTVLRMHPA